MTCPDDPQLTAMLQGFLDDDDVRALEAHLDGCDACMQLVVHLVGGEDGAASASSLPRVGRYEVLEHVGAGAQGMVVAAWDPQLQRRVALKLLRPDRDREPARLQREARVLASLSHPNVMPVFEVGAWGEGLYVATELGSGSLREQVDPPRPWAEVVATWLGVGAGLAAAHRAGLVHRDLKPDNVVLHPDGRPLLTDFGLASASPSAERSAGTPLYLAPELSDGQPADARSDQFAFCVSLYESLSGRAPFAGQTVAELAAAARRGPPSRPPGVPGAVHAVVCRGLAPDPDARFADLESLCEALQVAARPRPRWPLALAAAALLVAVGGLAVGTLGAVGVAGWLAVVRPGPVPPVLASPVAAPPAPVPSDAPPGQRSAEPCDALAAELPPEPCDDPRCTPVRVSRVAGVAQCYLDVQHCAPYHRWLDALAEVDPEVPVEVWRGSQAIRPLRPGDRRAELAHFLWMGRLDCATPDGDCLAVGAGARGWAGDPIVTDDDREALWWLQVSVVQMLDTWHADHGVAHAEADRAVAAFGRPMPQVRP